MLNRYTNYFVIVWGMVILTLLFDACQTTKFVPDNAYLLTKSKISIDDNSINKKEMKLYMKQKPNAKILGFWKFHLWLYNLSSKEKESGWLKRIGEAPVIYSPYLTEKSREEFLHFMQNRGFYKSLVTDTVILKKKKKAVVYYNIKANEPTLINSFNSIILDDFPFIANSPKSNSKTSFLSLAFGL